MMGMGYIASLNVEDLGAREAHLVAKMWRILVKSHNPEGNLTSINSLKRFIFIIEGLPNN